jgi:hypothetical protein
MYCLRSAVFTEGQRVWLKSPCRRMRCASSSSCHSVAVSMPERPVAETIHLALAHRGGAVAWRRLARSSAHSARGRGDAGLRAFQSRSSGETYYINTYPGETTHNWLYSPAIAAAPAGTTETGGEGTSTPLMLLKFGTQSDRSRPVKLSMSTRSPENRPGPRLSNYKLASQFSSPAPDMSKTGLHRGRVRV